MKLHTAIEFMNAQSEGIDPSLMARDVVSFAIDSRAVTAGSVFFALSQPDYSKNGFNGDFADATPFVPEAFDNGAVLCVVRPDRFDEHRSILEHFRTRIAFVDDPIAALQSLAHSVYKNWGKPVVAITGSAGKTTAKELTAHVLSSSGLHVLKNIKNYNNGLGHPLTVLNLEQDRSYDVAVLEMGMSTPMNEIARLCRITPPETAVVLNVLPVHVEHLGSIENVAKAKAELVEGMKPGGTAVLNADDPRVLAMAGLSLGRVMTFGIDNEANVTASGIEVRGFAGATFTLTTPNGKARVEFPLNGKHNIYNALAAAAVGTVHGLDAVAIADALSSIVAPPQRGEVLRFKQGFTVINDSYNSNPDALVSMIETMMSGAIGLGRRIVVAGEMLELGENAAEIHRTTGRKIAGLNVDLLIGVRGLAAELTAGAEEQGIGGAIFAEDSVSAGEVLCGLISKDDVVLVKGSRGVRTEIVIEKLLEKFELEEGDAA